MSGPIYKDSLGRCEPSSMLYDTIRNPNAPPYIPPKPTVSASKDTLETNQQRVNREVLEKFEGVGKRLPHDSFIAVVQVGKYVFLAIMLPPYLCMYGIPRWLIVTALPELFLFVKNQSIHIGRFIQEIGKQLTDLMKGLMEQMIGDSLKMLQQQSKNLWSHLSAATQNMMAALLKSWQRFENYASQLKQKVADPLQQLYAKSAAALNASLDLMRAKAEAFLDAVKQGINRSLQMLANKILAPIKAWLSSPIAQSLSFIQGNAQWISAQLMSRFEQGRKWLQSSIAAIQKNYQESSQYLARQFTKLVQPMLDWTKEKAEEISEPIRKALRKMASKIEEVAENVKSKIHDFFAPKVEMMQQAFQMIPQIAFGAAYWMWGKVPASTKNRLQKQREKGQRWGRALKRFGGALGGKISNIADRFNKKIIQRVANMWKWLTDLMHQFRMWIRKQLLALPQRLKLGMIYLKEKLIVGSQKLLRWMRLGIAFAWIIFNYGTSLIRELIDDISSWLMQRDQA